jgi:signal transduction histidine kinase
LSFWSRLQSLLRDVPISDPVDRRNAPAMQVLFLFMGLATPVLWGYHIAYAGMPKGGLLSMSTSLMQAAIQLFAISMIRRGQFRPAIRLYLGAALVATLIEYLYAGAFVMAQQQIEPFMALIIGGLVLGRPSLWVIFVVLQLITAAGFTVDLLRAHEVDRSFANLLTSMISQLVFTLILDRTVNTLRETLSESQQRGRDLEREMHARERVQSQLIHAQKLEATGRLASGIAHDFGNILSLITGYASQRDRILGIEGRDEQEAAIDKTLSGIASAADRGTVITRKLLSFSRHELARPKVFDAAQAIVAMQPMLRQLLPSSIALELPEQTPAMPVVFDHSEFELMILNIAANARDAMPQGGTFRIELAADAAATHLALSDTGHGMDAQTQERIFDPFFSTKVDTGGTGLGLAVIRDMILAGGGEISVDSAPGHGSVFRIRLPADRPDDPKPGA